MAERVPITRRSVLKGASAGLALGGLSCLDISLPAMAATPSPSGTGGGSKYGNFRVTPITGDLIVTDMASPKSDEAASPGYYAVTLTRYGIRAELTTGGLAALHRYTFADSADMHLVFEVTSIVFAWRKMPTITQSRATADISSTTARTTRAMTTAHRCRAAARCTW